LADERREGAMIARINWEVIGHVALLVVAAIWFFAS
jgi:hypothetical protein